MRKVILLCAFVFSTVFVFSQEKVFTEVNGLLVFEIEETTTQLGEWVKKTNISGYSGNCHLEFTGNTTSSGPASSPLTFKLRIKNPGTYRLMLRAHKRLEGLESDKCNDAYVRLAGDFTSGNDAPLNVLTSNTKLYGGSASGWGWAIQLNPAHDVYYQPRYVMKAGEYTFTISGRSQRFNVDRIIFYNVGSVNESTAKNASATPIEGGCDEPGCYDFYTNTTFTPEDSTEYFEGEEIDFESKVGGEGYGLGDVHFYIDDVEVHSKSSYPYRYSFTATQPGEHSIYSILYSEAGKAFYSDTLTYFVRPVLEKNFRVEFEDFLQNNKTREGGCTEGTDAISTTGSGAYATYKIAAPVAGEYTLRARYSTSKDDCEINFHVGDSLFANFPLSNTGGWQNWNTTTPIQVQLPADTITVVATLVEPNYRSVNLNYFEYFHTETFVPVKKVKANERWKVWESAGLLQIVDKASADSYQITVYNIQGALLYSNVLSGNQQISMPDAYKGMVLVKLQDETSQFVEKIWMR